MSDGYTIIERRGNKVTITRHDGKGGTQILEKIRRTKSGTTRGGTGYWQLSQTNGFIGTEADKIRAMAADAATGVTIDYIKTHELVSHSGKKMAAYRAAFKDKAHKNQWLRSKGRVDKDACYSAPCPGDFVGKMYPEAFPT